MPDQDISEAHISELPSQGEPLTNNSIKQEDPTIVNIQNPDREPPRNATPGPSRQPFMGDPTSSTQGTTSESEMEEEEDPEVQLDSGRSSVIG